MKTFSLVICDRPGRLDQWEGSLSEATALSQAGIHRILESQNVSIPLVDVVVYVNPAFTLKELGFGGYSPSSNVILISVDPNFPDLSRSIKENLPGTLAHELHHCMRWSGPGYGTTLYEALITEGLASDFERTFGGGRTPCYVPKLSPGTISDLLDLALKEFDSKSYQHNDWFFGSKERGIPACAGYALGLFLVDRYKEATGKRTAELVNMTAEQVRLAT